MSAAKLPNQPTEGAQALHDAAELSMKASNYKNAYNNADFHEAWETSAKHRHRARLHRGFSAGQERAWIIDETYTQVENGDDISLVQYKSATQHAVTKPLVRGSDIEGPDLQKDKVELVRVAANSHTGEHEKGAVTRLTGERARRAKEILNHRAARPIGALASKKITEEQ